MAIELSALEMLAVPALWSVAASLSPPPVRALRNVGVLGSYAAGAWALYSLGPREAGTAWVGAAAVTAVLAFGYEVLLWSKTKKADALPRSGQFVSALVAWPSQLPEAIEHLVSELGWPGKPRPPAAPPGSGAAE